MARRPGRFATMVASRSYRDYVNRLKGGDDDRAPAVSGRRGRGGPCRRHHHPPGGNAAAGPARRRLRSCRVSADERAGRGAQRAEVQTAKTFLRGRGVDRVGAGASRADHLPRPERPTVGRLGACRPPAGRYPRDPRAGLRITSDPSRAGLRRADTRRSPSTCSRRRAGQLRSATRRRSPQSWEAFRRSGSMPTCRQP